VPAESGGLRRMQRARGAARSLPLTTGTEPGERKRNRRATRCAESSSSSSPSSSCSVA
jgi:hypothetical protein